MKIYLAARYSRREELLGYAAELEAMGHTVTSRWLRGNHEGQDASFNDGLVDGASWAVEDLEDLMSAEVVTAFTEVPRSGHGRGGRHVEFGVAIGTGMRLMAIGPRENVFYCLPEVRHFEAWPGAQAITEALKEGDKPGEG